MTTTTSEKDDIGKIIEKYVSALLENREIKENKNPLGYRVISENCPHGIYIYDRKTGLWKLITNNELIRDGYYVIYFNNSQCIACKLFDFSWYIFIETIGKNYENIIFIIVRCEWFTTSCNSKLAKEYFKKFNITSSPSLILIKAKNRKIIVKKHIRGVKSPDELVEEIEKFMQT